MSQLNSLTLEAAKQMDAMDTLRDLQSRFYKTPGKTYMDGNSLGLLSKDAELAVLKALETWKTEAIEGWTDGPTQWFNLPNELGAKIAPLLGAKPSECIVTGSTTTNLHNLLATFYKPKGTRTKLLGDTENFPTDLYALDSHIRLHNRPPSDLILVPGDARGMVSDDDIIAQFSDQIAVALVPVVWYKTGQLADIARIAAAAAVHGIVLGVDCCHSIGAVPHDLHACAVDFAIWCNYKYLNGGPGATAGLYVHEKHHHLYPGLAGWFSSKKDRQFDMAFPLEPAEDVGKWQMGSPSILSTVSTLASLNMIAEVGIDALRTKSLSLTDYLRTLLEERVIKEKLGGRIITPIEPSRRGGHISFAHPEAVQLAKALRHHGIVPDFRPADIIRLAPMALYTTYTEIWHTVDALARILRDEEHRSFSADRDVVS